MKTSHKHDILRPSLSSRLLTPQHHYGISDPLVVKLHLNTIYWLNLLPLFLPSLIAHALSPKLYSMLISSSSYPTPLSSTQSLSCSSCPNVELRRRRLYSAVPMPGRSSARGWRRGGSESKRGGDEPKSTGEKTREPRVCKDRALDLRPRMPCSPPVRPWNGGLRVSARGRDKEGVLRDRKSVV